MSTEFLKHFVGAAIGNMRRAKRKGSAADAPAAPADAAPALQLESRPPPPADWTWPREGEHIEVEVALTDSARAEWCSAQVTAVLVDGWFSARIEARGDAWTDWFTWQEEHTDWRRKGTAPPARAARRAAAAPAPRAPVRTGLKLRLRVDRVARTASIVAAESAASSRPEGSRASARAGRASIRGPSRTYDASLIGAKVCCHILHNNTESAGGGEVAAWTAGVVTAYDAASRAHTIRVDLGGGDGDLGGGDGDLRSEIIIDEIRLPDHSVTFDDDDDDVVADTREAEAEGVVVEADGVRLQASRATPSG